MAVTYNTDDRPDFVSQQYAFTAHIRDPKHHPRPNDVEARRMKIYRDLFYNNVEGFIANTYPVLRSITSDVCWHAMIRDYFSCHLSHTPLFPEMPREFLKYLEHERIARHDDPVFMLELAHYEWVELALSILDEKIDVAKINPESDLFEGIPVISPLAWSFSYHFPVHKIGPTFQPEQVDGSLTHLVVYRDCVDEIHFMEVNQATARLIQLIISNRHECGYALLEQVAIELNHPQPEVVINGGKEILNDLRSRDIVLGIRA